MAEQALHNAPFIYNRQHIKRQLTTNPHRMSSHITHLDTFLVCAKCMPFELSTTSRSAKCAHLSSLMTSY